MCYLPILPWLWPNTHKNPSDPIVYGTRAHSLVSSVEISASKLQLAWAVSFPPCREPGFLSPSAIAELPPCLGMGEPSTDTALPPPVIPERSHTHPHTPGHSESQPFVCVTPLHKGTKLQSAVSNPAVARLRNRGFSSLYDKQSTGWPRHNPLGSTMPGNNTTHCHAAPCPSQCVKHCLCWVLHWSTCCHWNSLPWQSFGSIVLLQMVIISTDLVRKWNAFFSSFLVVQTEYPWNLKRIFTCFRSMNPLASEQALQALTEAESKQLAVLTEKPWLGLVSNLLQLTKAPGLPRPCHTPSDGSRL